MLITNSSDENGQFNISFERSYSLNFKAESNISKPYENTAVKPNWLKFSSLYYKLLFPLFVQNLLQT